MPIGRHWIQRIAFAAQPVAQPAVAMARSAVRCEQGMSARGIERCGRQVHGSCDAERALELRFDRAGRPAGGLLLRPPRSACRESPGSRSIVARESLRDLPRIGKKTRWFQCIRPAEISCPVAVDGFAIFLDGHTDDARKSFGRIFLGSGDLRRRDLRRIVASCTGGDL